MKNDFLIISSQAADHKVPYDLEHIKTIHDYDFYASSGNVKYFEDITLFVDGYVIPRLTFYEQWKHLGQYELVYKLYKEYGEEFVEYIKGFFCIVLIEGDKINVYTDHFGIYKIFYMHFNNKFICSDSVYRLSDCNNLYRPAVHIKGLLNREINGNTIFKNVRYSKPATRIKIKTNSVGINEYFDYSKMIEKDPETKSYQNFADLFKKLIIQYQFILNPEKSVISLTGGKDSRTALAALLAKNIFPVGLTYGSGESRDAVYAKRIAEEVKINHYVFNPEKTAVWYENESIEIIKKGNPLINIHRSHRFYAFRKMNEICGPDVSYYAGYMGGELLMGIYYDNLIFSKFLTDYWETSEEITDKKIKDILTQRFIRYDSSDFINIQEQLTELKSFDPLLDKLHRQFHGLFEIGIFHHSQDLFLARHFFKYPVPIFLDIDLLQELFASYYSFLYRDNKTRNLLKRYSLYEFNLNVQHLLCPLMDSVFFAKKGSYNTREFLKGPLYWSIIKSCRYLFEKKKYPPSFSYNNDYKKFLLKWLNEIVSDKSSVIHEVYNVEDSIKSLSVSPVFTTENELLPYSSIVMHYLQLINFRSHV